MFLHLLLSPSLFWMALVWKKRKMNKQSRKLSCCFEKWNGLSPRQMCYPWISSPTHLSHENGCVVVEHSCVVLRNGLPLGQMGCSFGTTKVIKFYILYSPHFIKIFNMELINLRLLTWVDIWCKYLICIIINFKDLWASLKLKNEGL